MIVHHTDAEREYAYDRQSHFGRLDVALDMAVLNKWTVIDMKKIGYFSTQATMSLYRCKGVI